MTQVAKQYYDCVLALGQKQLIYTKCNKNTAAYEAIEQSETLMSHEDFWAMLASYGGIKGLRQQLEADLQN